VIVNNQTKGTTLEVDNSSLTRVLHRYRTCQRMGTLECPGYQSHYQVYAAEGYFCLCSGNLSQQVGEICIRVNYMNRSLFQGFPGR